MGGVADEAEGLGNFDECEAVTLYIEAVKKHKGIEKRNIIEFIEWSWRDLCLLIHKCGIYRIIYKVNVPSTV